MNWGYYSEAPVTEPQKPMLIIMAYTHFGHRTNTGIGDERIS